jgi:hypothetical protein
MNQTKFRPSIIHYASVHDCQMILKELHEDIAEVITDKSQLIIIKQILLDKQDEVMERYNRNRN